MGTLNIINNNEYEKWDKIIKSFDFYDIYYLSGYTKAFEIHGDGEPTLFYYQDTDIRAINVTMKRKIPCSEDTIENGWYDLCSPYGYGGWIIEGSGNIEGLTKEYNTWCIQNNIVSEFIRFHPVLENYSGSFVQENYELTQIGPTVALNLTNSDIIWSNFSSKNRNTVRKSQKNNINICYGRVEALYKQFQGIYNLTMLRHSAKKYYYFDKVFYESIFNDLPRNALVFYAWKDTNIIAAAIMLVCNGYMNYHLSASLPEYAKYAPVNLLLYEAALWGHEMGLKSLHLGGGIGAAKDSLYAFKKSFNKKESDKKYYIGKKIFNHAKYCELVNHHTNHDLNSTYFPAYRS